MRLLKPIFALCAFFLTSQVSLAQAPDLVIVKDDGGITAAAGDVVAYVLTASNIGSQDASNVVLSETVPVNTTFAGGTSDPGWFCSGTTPGSTCSLGLGLLTAGATPQIAVFAVEIDSPLPTGVNSISNTATISDDGAGGADLDPSNNTSSDSTPLSGTTAPDLVVVKSDGDITAAAGDVIVYGLTVSNVGSRDASGVVLS